MMTFFINYEIYGYLFVWIICLILFFKLRKNNIGYRAVVILFIIIISFYLKKKLTFVIDGFKTVDKDTIDLLFDVLYFYMILNLIYGYIDFIFKNKPTDKKFYIVRLFKMISFVFLFMCFGERFYLSASGVITFGSISGIVIGMASKPVLSNFIAGVMLYFDKPFNVGDSISSPQDKFSGSILKIGFRITTVLNDAHQLVYIPNSLFSTLVINNVSRAENKKIDVNLLVIAEDYAKLNAFITEMTNMMSANEDIMKENQSCSITNVVAPNINIEIACFVCKNNYPNFNTIRNNFILQIMDLLNKKEIRFSVSE